MKAKRVIVQDIKHVFSDLRCANAALYANAIKSITIDHAWKDALSFYNNGNKRTYPQ
jgi:hypothetical protein